MSKTPIQIEVMNEDIAKVAEGDERFRYLMQLTAAMRTIDELTAQIAELRSETERDVEPIGDDNHT
jgi:sulfur transfer protein SufE